VLGRDKDPAIAAQIDGAWVALFSILALVAGIVVWELWTRRRAQAAAGGGGAAPGGESS
jgi:hypothetical protein